MITGIAGNCDLRRSKGAEAYSRAKPRVRLDPGHGRSCIQKAKPRSAQQAFVRMAATSRSLFKHDGAHGVTEPMSVQAEPHLNCSACSDACSVAKPQQHSAVT